MLKQHSLIDLAPKQHSTLAAFPAQKKWDNNNTLGASQLSNLEENLGSAHFCTQNSKKCFALTALLP
jgi:hypothetical protein